MKLEEIAIWELIEIVNISRSSWGKFQKESKAVGKFSGKNFEIFDIWNVVSMLASGER